MSPVAQKRVWDQRGFALPIVLGLVAVLALVLIAGLSALSALREETRSTLAAVEFERTAVTAEARLQFLVLTEPFGSKGLRIGGTRATGGRDFTIFAATDYLSMLYADNRPYRWRDGDDAPDYRVAVQDEAGLVNLFQADSAMASRLMQQAGLSADDGDQIATELVEYNAEPAPHEPIRRLAELMSLPSGRQLISDKAFTRLDRLATAQPDSAAVNINTAPREVLKAWFDLSESQLDQGVKDRDESDVGLLSPSAIGAQTTGSGNLYTSPGGRVRFTFTDPRTGLSYRSTLVLTPNSQERPVWVENVKTQRQRPLPETTDDELEDFPAINPGAS